MRGATPGHGNTDRVVLRCVFRGKDVGSSSGVACRCVPSSSPCLQGCCKRGRVHDILVYAQNERFSNVEILLRCDQRIVSPRAPYTLLSAALVEFRPEASTTAVVGLVSQQHSSSQLDNSG